MKKSMNLNLEKYIDEYMCTIRTTIKLYIYKNMPLNNRVGRIFSPNCYEGLFFIYVGENYMFEEQFNCKCFAARLFGT